MEKINYAFGKDYLSNWGLIEALREIFQNYIDFGDYKVQTHSYENTNNLLISITNNYIPTELEFLRLGNSSKKDGDKIGHHGEGLKAAFLIFARENLYFRVISDKYSLLSGFDKSIIGDTLYISYEDATNLNKKEFITEFHCPKDVYDSFINNIITPKDVLFHDENYGDLLHSHKGQGNIYSGNLFVCNVKGLQHSYNIKPNKLELDRDRKAPHNFDLDYATSNILTSYKRSVDTINDYKPINYNSREYNYSSYVSEEDIKHIDAINVKGKVQFYDKQSKEMIVNHRVKETLAKHPKFTKIKKLSYKSQLKVKTLDAKRKKTITLIKDFKKNYCANNIDMSIDIDIITDRVKTNK